MTIDELIETLVYIKKHIGGGQKVAIGRNMCAYADATDVELGGLIKSGSGLKIAGAKNEYTDYVVICNKRQHDTKER